MEALTFTPIGWEMSKPVWEVKKSGLSSLFFCPPETMSLPQ
jgi:hypothetical protein